MFNTLLFFLIFFLHSHGAPAEGSNTCTDPFLQNVCQCKNLVK